jgi:hypothetical protein
MSKQKKLKYKTVQGRIKVLKAIDYKGSMIYLRQIDGDIFMYDLVFKGEIYSSYLVMKPKPGCKELTPDEVNQSAALIFVGAVTTVDMKLGHKLDKKTLQMAKTFEEVGKNIFADPKKKKEMN